MNSILSDINHSLQRTDELMSLAEDMHYLDTGSLIDLLDAKDTLLQRIMILLEDNLYDEDTTRSVRSDYSTTPFE